MPIEGEALALAAGAAFEATTAPEVPVVTLWVSSGPDAVEVPSVRAKTQEDARLAIEDAGLKVGSVEIQDDPEP
ncbi:PASTA domain-containing protein [Demequina litorisediminis]|uniref:PASTA domain-containing protein n=1 Tax=Demequina litorisediminis TaxID=1849022 RepID=UPI0024E0B270|nr:PASTA domain-containing protein [Demequina litorisediminis]